MKKTDFFNIQIHHISSHKRPIRTLDSSNWSLWPDKSLWFYKLGIGVTWGYLGSFGVKLQKCSNLGKLYTKMKLFIRWLRKNGFRGQSRSPDPKFGVFGVIWGQNQKNSKPRKIIYQNDALDPVIKKKWFSRSYEVIRPQNWGYLGSFGVKIQRFSNLDFELG